MVRPAWAPLLLLGALAGCEPVTWAPAAPGAAALGTAPAAIPAPPSDTYLKGSGAGKVMIYWTDNADNEHHYQARRETRNPDGTFGSLAVLGNRGPNTSSFLDTTAVIGSTYRYRVRACNDDGCAYGPYSAAITVLQPPARPAQPAAVLTPFRRVEVTWVDSSSNEGSFRVRRALRDSAGVFGPFVLLPLLPPNTTAYTDTSVAAGRVYRYTVQACNAGGCGVSTAVVVTVPQLPAAPTSANAVLHNDHVDLGWNDLATNETRYRVRRSVKLGSTFQPFLQIDELPAGSNSYPDFSAEPGRTYRYYVQACNHAGCTSSNITGTVSMPAAP